MLKDEDESGVQGKLSSASSLVVSAIGVQNSLFNMVAPTLKQKDDEGTSQVAKPDSECRKLEDLELCKFNAEYLVGSSSDKIQATVKAQCASCKEVLSKIRDEACDDNIVRFIQGATGVCEAKLGFKLASESNTITAALQLVNSSKADVELRDTEDLLAVVCTFVDHVESFSAGLC